ncbi:MAG: SAM-dependent methyltransferase [Elusimicrobiota bacterium]
MITFRDFMESSLYDPETGFYPHRRSRDDFYTAPELHPAFAEVLAGEIAARLHAVAEARPAAPLFIVEMGSGDGALARQVLGALKENHRRWFCRARYVLVERVESALLESIFSLQDVGAQLLGYSRLDEIQPLCGVLFSNELVDAMPVHLLEKRDREMREVFVDRRCGRGRCLGARLGIPSRRELSDAARRVGPSLPEGGRHAVSLEARTWMRTVARVLKAGSVITVDYGKRFAPRAPNPPRSFYRHTTGDDILARPGRQDLTASVDFSQLIAEGERRGLRTASYTTLGRFLLERGILQRMPSGMCAAAFAERSRIKTLFHPEGMGDVFKVLVQEKGLLP